MIRVCFLPVAGKEDPGQQLRMQGLRDGGPFEAVSGDPGRFFAGFRTCLKYRPDILHFDWIGRYIHGRTHGVTLFKVLAFAIDVQIVTKIFRRPIVWTLHNLRSHEESSNGGLENRMQRYFARHVTTIRVFSQSSVERASTALGVERGKLRVLPEGDFSAYYPNSISPAEARSRLGFTGAEFVLLWLGSIRPYKGIQELIEAFRAVAEPHWRLVIAGKPFIESYAEEIVRLAQGDARIQVHPRFIPEDELQVYYNTADVVALPFVEVENSGSVCLAMGFRKPIVAPNLGVIGERLQAQPELIYAPGGLPDALQALAKLSSVRLQEIGEANYREIKRYSWNAFGRFFMELCNEWSLIPSKKTS